MAEFPTFKGSWPWPWPWIGSHCIPSCVIHRPLPTIEETFCVRTDVPTDGHFRHMLLGRLGGVDLTSLRETSSKHGPARMSCERWVLRWWNRSLTGSTFQFPARCFRRRHSRSSSGRRASCPYSSATSPALEWVCDTTGNCEKSQYVPVRVLPHRQTLDSPDLTNKCHKQYVKRFLNDGL